MLKKAAALFLVCASFATWMACGTTSSHYVYVAVPQADQVLAYREDPNSGVLTALPASPFTAGTGAQALALHPSKKFLYVANSGENDISLFTIASNGALTEVTPRTVVPGSTPMFVAMDAAGAFLYVAEAGSQDVAVFSIDSSSGALTTVPQNFGPTAPLGLLPISMALSPSGTSLYIGGDSSTGGVIEVFGLTSGVLSATSSAATDGTSPFGLVLDPAGKYLYAANTVSNSIAEFTVGSNGSLTPILGSPLGGSLTSPTALLVDPSDKFLYVANDTSSGKIAAYTIGSGGALTVLSGSPFSVGANPDSLIADPNGKYLLVGTQGSSGQIHVFGLSESAGTLSSLASYSTGNSATSIVIVQ